MIFVSFKSGNQLELRELLIVQFHFSIGCLLAKRCDENGTRSGLDGSVYDNFQIVDENHVLNYDSAIISNSQIYLR